MAELAHIRTVNCGFDYQGTEVERSLECFIGLLQIWNLDSKKPRGRRGVMHCIYSFILVAGGRIDLDRTEVNLLEGSEKSKPLRKERKKGTAFGRS